MSQRNTHQLITRTVYGMNREGQTVAGGKQTVLVREADGMVIGAVQDGRCSCGENPNDLDTRVFINDEKAIAYLRKFADTDYTRNPAPGEGPLEFGKVRLARIEEVDGDARVIPAGRLKV